MVHMKIKLFHGQFELHDERRIAQKEILSRVISYGIFKIFNVEFVKFYFSKVTRSYFLGFFSRQGYFRLLVMCQIELLADGMYTRYHPLCSATLNSSAPLT